MHAEAPVLGPGWSFAAHPHPTPGGGGLLSTLVNNTDWVIYSGSRFQAGVPGCVELPCSADTTRWLRLLVCELGLGWCASFAQLFLKLVKRSPGLFQQLPAEEFKVLPGPKCGSCGFVKILARGPGQVFAGVGSLEVF